MSLLLPALLASLAVQAGTASDAEGRELTVKDPQCIVVLGASVAETVHALGHGDKVCAADASVATFGPLAKTVRLPYHRQLSAEGVLAQGTDLVLADAASGPPTAIEQLRTAGVPVFLVDRTATVAGAQERAKTLERRSASRSQSACVGGGSRPGRTGLLDFPRRIDLPRLS